MNPVLKETVWGGDALSSFGLNLVSSKIGEAWIVSAHENGDCIIKDCDDRLSSLWKKHPEFFGRKISSLDEKFPLLTKIIDANDDLSIQVHPDDEYALKNENGSLGKTECWYVLDAKPGAKIVIGHNAKDTDEVKMMIENQKWHDFIREVPVKKGDFFFIEPGTVHAIKGGTLILETQQSSDITYRVYDYDRLQNGKKRELHVRQCMEVIEAPFVEKSIPLDASKKLSISSLGTDEKSVSRQLVSCDKFTVYHMNVKSCCKVIQDKNFMIVSVIDGAGSVDGISIEKGSSFILPYGYGNAMFDGKMELIVSFE